MINKNKGEKSDDDDSGGNISTARKGPVLEGLNDGILNLNTEKLYQEYCSRNFGENSLLKFENMYNDFKIILKLVESLKNEYKYGEYNQNSANSNTNPSPNGSINGNSPSPSPNILDNKNVNSSSQIANLIDL